MGILRPITRPILQPILRSPLEPGTTRRRRNLLLWSEAFDNAIWGNANTLVTANAATAPDGAQTADLLYPASTGTFRDKTQAITNAAGVVTASCYMKAAGKTWGYFRNMAASNIGAHFNLATGTVGTVQGGLTATISDAGNGLYRCTMTGTAVANMIVCVGVSDADNSSAVTANGADGIHVWGAQVNPGTGADDYIATTTTPVS